MFVNSCLPAEQAGMQAAGRGAAHRDPLGSPSAAEGGEVKPQMLDVINTLRLAHVMSSDRVFPEIPKQTRRLHMTSSSRNYRTIFGLGSRRTALRVSEAVCKAACVCVCSHFVCWAWFACSPERNTGVWLRWSVQPHTSLHSRRSSVSGVSLYAFNLSVCLSWFRSAQGRAVWFISARSVFVVSSTLTNLFVPASIELRGKSMCWPCQSEMIQVSLSLSCTFGTSCIVGSDVNHDKLLVSQITSNNESLSCC